MSDKQNERDVMPRLGDTIETVEPISSYSPRAGHRLRVTLETVEAVNYARQLIALGRWRIVRDNRD